MKIVNGEGILNPQIAIVGEAPGELEDIEGRPFVGMSGVLLNSVLEELKIDRKQCYITNAVKIRPPNNRTPTDDEIKIWRGILLEELYVINPKIIVTLGATATKALYECSYPGDDIVDIKITKIRGQVFFNEYMHRDFIPSLHPSYCLRNPKETDKLKADLKKALGYGK